MNKIFEAFRIDKKMRTMLAGSVLVLIAMFLMVISFFFFHQIGSGRKIVFNPFYADTQTPDPNRPTLIPTNTPFIPTPQWDSSSRVTLLVMGLDYRDWESSSDASRSDTMILLSVDPVAKTAGVVSVPRDLWASIPGFDPHKINMAYYLGDAYKLPGGGPGLAMKTVEQVLGIPVDYYAVVNFDTFVRFIDLIDGIKVDVPEEIKVFIIHDGVGKTKIIKPGLQVLPGELALGYARARHTSGGDFDRAERQQQVIMGIRNRILEPGKFQNLLVNAPRIYAELSSGLITNLSFEDTLKLAALATQIKKKDIHRGVIDEKYVTFGRSPDNLAILIPIPDKIRQLRNEIFAENASFSPYTQGEFQDRMKLENARISVQNGTAAGDLASRTAEYLGSLGFTVVEVNEFSQAAAQTRITDRSGRPFTLQYLLDIMGINSRYLYHEFTPNSSIDIEILLGSDWFYSNPLP